MQSVGSFFSTVSKFYSELNPATLSGAIDVVVVEQPNGDLACSPFHVRFGKLSILRPQEKVVEVTINGQVVNFPMKVGDAGEAFFVFETEQDVPEEFATSPLAGPSEDKIEEEIDFLDLAQEVATTAVPRLDDQDAGYVSAHSGHGSEFEEDEQESSSPGSIQRHDFLSTGQIRNLDSWRQENGAVSVRSHLSISISLPCSPILKAHDVMENFQPRGIAETSSQQPSTPIPSIAGNGSHFLTPHGDGVIMDMTGYKTDDSAETDLESDGPSREGGKALQRTRRRNAKVTRPSMRVKSYDNNGGIKSTNGSTDPATHDEYEATDPRLPARPLQRPLGRPLAVGRKSKRSSSVPNLRDSAELATSVKAKMASVVRTPSSKDTPAANARAQLKGLGSVGPNPKSSADLSLSSLTEEERRGRFHRQDKQPGDNIDSNYSRKHSQKPDKALHTKKPSSRSNLALNALSDTELEYKTPRTAKATQDSEWTWGWGSLPVKNDIMDDMTDSEQKERHTGHVAIDMASTPKPLLNDIDVDGVTYRVAISLCPGDDFGKDPEASEAMFATNQIAFEEFSKDPLKILNNKCLVCLINDRYFTWAAAGPYLASLMLFKKPLSDEVLHQLSIKDARHLSDRMPAPEPSTRFGVLSRWLRGSQAASQLDAMEQGQPRPPHSDGALRSEQAREDAQHKMASLSSMQHRPETEAMTRSTSMPIGTGEDSLIVGAVQQQLQPHQSTKKPSKRYAKTLRLTSEQLRSLNLKKGANTLTFSVTSSYQGKAVCSAKLFLWDHDYQVVISDIDGTITKSDALGHIFTMAGKDWTHTGVAKLYTDIVNNGYHILYLTSRAIGQADYTRKYLKNVEQNNYQLPDGPVIMSPDRLMTAFHREVIMRKPEEFKMACLRDIRRLFGDRNPFYAGFGNRITDALSYRSVNVPSSRIFTIDSGGEVKLELLSTYKSSYLALNDLVNEIFPGKRHAPEFNDWNYWKPSLPTIELPLAPSNLPTLPLTPIEIGSSRLGVIRSFTSSFTSSSSLKKRPSIPTFNSTPLTTSSTSSSAQAVASSQSASSPRLSSTSTASTAPPPPPVSAPGGLQIADRTRRLSLSLMRYGGSSILQAGTAHPPTSSGVGAINSQGEPITASEPLGDGVGGADGQHQQRLGSRMRGMSMTSSSSGYVPSNLGTSPPTSFLISPSSSEATIRPLDIQTVKKASSFSVSPPQLASRLETVIPFLRRQVSRPEPNQGPHDTEIGGHRIVGAVSEGEDQQGEHHHQDGAYDEYVEESYEEGEGHEEEDAGEYEEEEYDEEGENGLLDDDDDDDDVELNIDAPFL